MSQLEVARADGIDLGLGREIAPADPRDRAFLAVAHESAMTEGTDWLTKPLEELGNPYHLGTRYWNDNGLWTDQDGTGTCVGHGTLYWCEDSPIRHPDSAADPFDWYRHICLLDPWTGNDSGDLDFGTTVHAAAKFLKARGHVGTYLWIRDLETAIRWLLAKGTLLVGTTWLYSNFDTVREKDAGGNYRSFVQFDPSQGVAGGHCYTWTGVNIWAEAIRIKLGSWNRDYFGVDGRSNLHFDHAEQMIVDWGEIMAAPEIAGIPLEVSADHPEAMVV